MRKLLSPFWLLSGGLALAIVTFAVLWLTPSGDYIFLPDRAIPVAPLVTIKGKTAPQQQGGIYLVDIRLSRASLFEDIFPGIHDGASLVPASEVNPPGASDAARLQEDIREMSRSQQIAAAVALRASGKKVAARPTGVLITAVIAKTPAAGRLQPGDVVTAVDGASTRTPLELSRRMAQHHPGDRVRLTVRSTQQVRVVSVTTEANPSDPKRAFIGVEITQAADIKLPVPVRINVGDIGGPSAGLAFALDILEALGRDVDRGYKVAATGELALDGSVLEIGGVKQKTIGARKAGVDVFIVPGDNAAEARRYAHGLRIIPVNSFRQALRALATLPPKT